MKGGVSLLQILRNHRVTQTEAGEARVLREAPDLDGAGPRPVALIDGMREIRIRDVGLIGRVIDDHAAFPIGVVHPPLKLLLRDRRAGRVVGEAEIDQIRPLLREIGDEAVRLGAGHIDHIAPVPGFRIVCAGAAGHHVGIHVDRIDRIADRDPRVVRKQLLNVAGVAFRAVRDEDLVGPDIAAPRPEIAVRDRLTQE